MSKPDGKLADYQFEVRIDGLGSFRFETLRGLTVESGETEAGVSAVALPFPHGVADPRPPGYPRIGSLWLRVTQDDEPISLYRVIVLVPSRQIVRCELVACYHPDRDPPEREGFFVGEFSTGPRPEGREWRPPGLRPYEHEPERLLALRDRLADEEPEK